MKSYKIVIIEDEELIREELKTLLVNAGYVVDCVINFAKTIWSEESDHQQLCL